MPLGQGAGAVGGGVVDDEQVDARRVALEGLDELVQGGSFVVGRHDGHSGGEGGHEPRMRPSPPLAGARRRAVMRDR